MTPAHLIMSYAQESGAVGKEKVNFTEREGSFFLSESLAHVFGWLPFFLWHCAPPCEPWYSRQMVNHTKKKLHGVIDTCGKWVTSGRVSICKLLVIHSEVIKAGSNQYTGRPPISRLKPGPGQYTMEEATRTPISLCIDHVEHLCCSGRREPALDPLTGCSKVEAEL